MKFKVYLKLENESVEKIVTGTMNYQHTDYGYAWIDVDTNSNEYSEVSKTLKYAIPNMCEFKFGRFSPKSEFFLLFENNEEYEKLVKDQWIEVRILRNSLLNSTDWTQLNDAPISEEKKIEWMNYRKALRDIPSNTVNPYVVEWPDAPK